MGSLSRFQKISAIAFGIGSGFGIYLYTKNRDQTVLNSWTTSAPVLSPGAKWDSNWDHRDPKVQVKPLKSKNPEPSEENAYNQKLEEATPKAFRHIFLIRHGQYQVTGKSDKDRFLTELGRKQAACTGDRLKTLDIPWTDVIWSTMTRAQETGKIISTSLQPSAKVVNCSLIEEGAPIPPEPPIGHWRPEDSVIYDNLLRFTLPCIQRFCFSYIFPHLQQFFQDGARIEAGFRKYFHRADASQEKDSYTLVVCHANVIRYFVCRALQLPPEAWLRISLNHASVTWLTINPSGRVILRTLGDSGHMPPNLITSR